MRSLFVCYVYRGITPSLRFLVSQNTQRWGLYIAHGYKLRMRTPAIKYVVVEDPVFTYCTEDHRNMLRDTCIHRARETYMVL